MLGDIHEFPATPEQLSNDYHYQIRVRHGSETIRDESGWMRQSIRTINADESATLDALWQVREDYFPRGADTYPRQWQLGHDSIDRVWTLFAIRVDTEWLRYSAEGAGERGLIFTQSPMAVGETYPEQRIRWPGETGIHELRATVSVREKGMTRTRAGNIEAYRFSLDARSDDGEVTLQYRYWLNPKLGFVRETVVLEEHDPDHENRYFVTSTERELEDYYTLLDQ